MYPIIRKRKGDNSKMRTYKTFAIINVENDSLVILGRCSKEQLERMCEEMNATQGNHFRVEEVETW